MADARKAVGNVLDAVVSTSTAVCNVVNVVGKSALYGSNWMDSVLEKQAITLCVDTTMFEQSYAEVKAQELAQIRRNIEEWTNSNPRSAELYNQSLELIKAAIAAKKK